MSLPAVSNVTDWWAQYDDLLKKITDLVASNGPAWEIKSNRFAGDYAEISKGCVDLGFRDIVQFCESFPNKFLVDRETGNIKMNRNSQTEEKSTPQPNRWSSTTQKPNMDDETRALLFNYTPVPPSKCQRREEKEEEEINTNTSSSTISEKKSECIHFKFSHDEKTRRFAFPRESDLIGSVKERVEKIVERKEPTLFWRDEDSLIVLECGDDMEAAIDYAEHQKTPACVMLEATVDDEKTEPEVKEEPKAVEEVHKPTFVSREESAAAFNGFAFVCDVCDCFLGPSNGGRFKCAVCEDYDLCAACVVKGTHANHALVRLVDAETVVPLVDRRGNLKDAPRCTPVFVAHTATDFDLMNQEIEALRSANAMLELAINERMDEIKNTETRLANERRTLQKLLKDARKVKNGQSIAPREEDIPEFQPLLPCCPTGMQTHPSIEESDDGVQFVSVCQRKKAGEEVLSTVQRLEQEIAKRQLLEEERRLEEERVKIEEEERQMIEERRQIIEEIAMYEVMQKEQEDLLRREEERSRLEEEELKYGEKGRREFMAYLFAQEERERARALEAKMPVKPMNGDTDKRNLNERIDELLEDEPQSDEDREIAEMGESIRYRSIIEPESAEDREIAEMAESIRYRSIIEPESEEDREIEAMGDADIAEMLDRYAELGREQQLLLGQDEDKNERLEEMMRTINGDLLQIGDAVEELSQIEVALSKELGDKKEDSNDLWIAYESWKEEVNLEQKERKDSSSLGSDIEIIDKLVEESDSVLETMHVLENKFEQLQLLPIRESAFPSLPDLPTVPCSAPTVHSYPTVPAMASSATVYTTAPSTPTVDAVHEFTFLGDSIAQTQPSAPEEPEGAVHEPVWRDFELNSPEANYIPVFMEHKVMLELFEMKNMHEVPIRMNQYCLSLGMNCDSLKEHKRILNKDKAVDDMLIRNIANELHLRLKEMRSSIGISMHDSYYTNRLLSRVCTLRAQIRRFSFDEDLRYRTICKDLHRLLLTDEFTVPPINPVQVGCEVGPGWPIPSTSSAFSPYFDALSMPEQVPVAQVIRPTQRGNRGEPLNEQQEALLTELFATGIFNEYDEGYERMVEVSRHATNLEQAIDMMLE